MPGAVCHFPSGSAGRGSFPLLSRSGKRLRAANDILSKRTAVAVMLQGGGNGTTGVVHLCVTEPSERAGTDARLRSV